MALMPLVGLGLLPDAVFKLPLVPYEVAFLFLLAIPLAYGYAIVRYKLIQLDRYINRSVAYTSVFMLLASLYVALNIGLERLLPGYLAEHPLTNALLVLGVAITFAPLYRRLQKLVDWAFYGGSYDYRTAVERITQGLDRVTEATTLTQLLTHRLQAVVGAKCAHLLLPTLNLEGELWLHGMPCQACASLEQMQTTPPALRKTGVISQYLRRQSSPVDAAKLRRALAGAPLAEAEQQLLSCEQARLWVPLMGDNDLLGVLILGPKRGSEVFDASDLSVLDVVARQVLVAIKNIQLTSELQRRAAEVERLHRRVMRVREEERKQLARELHDQIIQALVGLNYKLARFDNGQSAELRDQVRSVMGDLRRMCRELRPPVLDNLGLVPAVRSHLRELENHDSLKTELSIEGDEEQSLPEDVALCLFRTLQEALINVQKHAAARRAVINLTLQPQEVSLSVQDDGQGFIVPFPLSQLLDDNHFGLVGLRERLDLVNGKLEITSVPGQGTRLWARVPLLTTDPSTNERN